MLEAGHRKKNQPAPPRVIFEALNEPNRDPGRAWLLLKDDEQPPTVVEADAPSLLIWSSLWTGRPDARVRFDLPSDGHQGTALQWTLLVDEPMPDPAQLRHFGHRLNELINRNLRLSFGQ